MTLDWLTDDSDEILTDDDGNWLSGDELWFDPSVLAATSGYQLDVCRNFERIGSCDVFSFAGVVRRNETGEWSAEIPVGGVEFDGDATIDDVDSVILWEASPTRIVYAGSMRSLPSLPAGLTTSYESGGAMWALTGIDIYGILGTRLAYPNPATEAPWSTAYDTRTGPSSTVAAEYIQANMGTSATEDREIAGVEIINPVIGDTITWTARLQPLSTLVTQICNAASIVCRATMPTPGALRYEFTSGADRSSQTVISDMDTSDTITVSSVNARATRIIAGGSGELAARLFVAAADSSTGLDRVEDFYDVNNLTDVTALGLAARGELLQAQAETAVEFGRVMPSQWRYPDHFDIGDTISVEVDSVRYAAVVDAVSFTVNSSEAVIRPLLGRTTNNEVNQILRRLWGSTARFDSNIS